MNLRLLKYFAVLADELNYRRAAERLHIEISPLSRAIQSLETTLGVSLLCGPTVAPCSRRRGSATGAHSGHIQRNRSGARQRPRRGRWQSRRATYCPVRRNEPDATGHVDGRLPRGRAARGHPFSEVPFAQQLAGLDQGLYDLGFAPSDHVGRGIVAERAWQDPIHVVLPTGHPLLAMEVIPLSEVLRHPLVLGDPKYCEGCRQQIDRLISKGSAQPLVAAQVQSTYLMLSMVAAGVGLALVGASQALSNWELGILSRPLAEPAALTTWLLRSTRVARQNVARFVERVIAMREDTSPPSRAR